MDILSLNPFRIENAEKFYIDERSVGQSASDNQLIERFSDFVTQENYPCVGAQAAVNGKTFAIGDFGSMEQRDTPKNLAYGLTEYLMAMSQKPSDFFTYIAIFPESYFADERQFEAALWDLLERLHEEDGKHFDWNKAYSKNPDDTDFSFSFGERGFFMVGLHPESSRKARRFEYPAVAFNLQAQFDGLREKGRFDVMRESIRERELRFQGSVNPMLADYGEGLQAPQYSGRKVSKEWKCPFSGHN